MSARSLFVLGLCVLAGLGVFGRPGALFRGKLHGPADQVRSAGPPSPRGFEDTINGGTFDPAVVTVVGPVRCSREAGVQTEYLVSMLHERGIPVQRRTEVSFSYDPRGFDRALVDATQRTMGGPVPIVFVGGRAKNAPTVDEVIAEYRAAAR